MVNALIEGIGWYVVFLFSVTFHEAAHAWCARRGGDLTAYHGGQVSLDPVPHIRREPIGMVILPIASLVLFQWPFGFASTPYDPSWADRRPRRAALMSLAGPVANILLVLLAAIAIRVGVWRGYLSSPASVDLTRVTEAAAAGIWPVSALVLSMFFSLNLILTVLNLLPVPPLDGSGALPLILSEESARRWRELMSRSAFAWVGIVVAWYLFAPLFPRVFLVAVNLLYPDAQYR